MTHPVHLWHDVVHSRDTQQLSDMIAEDAVFYSPVVHRAQQGKFLTFMYLNAAVQVFCNDSFTYVRELTGDQQAILEFEVEIDGILVNGVDMIRWNENNQIIEFKVMLRPLKAVNLIHQKMAAMLQQG